MGRWRSQTPDVVATDEIELLLTRSGGVIARRDHPGLRARLDYLIRRGDLVAVLPGVYTPSALASRSDIRMRAAMLRHPDAVLVGEAAARVSYWPDLHLSDIELAVTTLPKPAPGYRFSRRRIPPELILHRDGLRCTDPALTAIDLATFACADAIDVALRTRAATLEGMYSALRQTPNRWGNADRRRLLLDSRNEPWSAAERRAHRDLRAARLTGWQTNWPVVLGRAALLHRHRLPRGQVGHRDRRPAPRGQGRLVPVRSLAAERPGHGRLAGGALHLADGPRSPRHDDRHGPTNAAGLILTLRWLRHAAGAGAS